MSDVSLLLEFTPGQDVGGIQNEYEIRLYVALVDYLEDTRSVATFENAFNRAVNDAFTLAFVAGKADAGNGDPLTEDEVDWLNARIGAELGFADTLWTSAKALRDSDDYTPQAGEAFAAAHAVSYASTIPGIYSEGKLRGALNKFLTFDGDDGAESCQTCQSLKGRRKPAKWWVEQELIPGQAGNRNYDCGGWNCQHYLVDDDGAIFAGYGSLDWAGESAGELSQAFVEFMIGGSVTVSRIGEGGPGSGNFGHSGVPGQIGGSGPGGGAGKVLSMTGDESFYSADTERILIFSDDGEQLYDVSSGDEHEVDTSSINAEDVVDAHMIHNHPSADLGSDTWTFSDKDIDTAADANLASTTVTGKYRTYTINRPEKGWGNHAEAMKQAQAKFKWSDKYVSDMLGYREGVFGDSPEQMNRDARKFWRAYAEAIETTYEETKRK